LRINLGKGRDLTRMTLDGSEEEWFFRLGFQLDFGVCLRERERLLLIYANAHWQSLDGWFKMS
jgi:hypothetical protein